MAKKCHRSSRLDETPSHRVTGGSEIYTFAKLRAMRLPGHFLCTCVCICCRQGAKMVSPGGGEKVPESRIFLSLSPWGAFWCPGCPRVPHRVLPGTIFHRFPTLFPSLFLRNGCPRDTIFQYLGYLSAGKLGTGKHKRGGGVGRSPLDIYIYIYTYTNTYTYMPKGDGLIWANGDCAQ